MTESQPTQPNADAGSVTIELDSTLEHVWEALTTADGLAGWMGDGAFVGHDVGSLLVLPDPVTGRQRAGVVDKVDAGRHLAYTWWPEDDPANVSTVAITIEPCDVGTRVTVVERLAEQPVPAAIASTETAISAVATSPTASWAWRTALLVLAVQAVAAAPALVLSA